MDVMDNNPAPDALSETATNESSVTGPQDDSDATMAVEKSGETQVEEGVEKATANGSRRGGGSGASNGAGKEDTKGSNGAANGIAGSKGALHGSGEGGCDIPDESIQDRGGGSNAAVVKRGCGKRGRSSGDAPPAEGPSPERRSMSPVIRSARLSRSIETPREQEDSPSGSALPTRGRGKRGRGGGPGAKGHTPKAKMAENANFADAEETQVCASSPCSHVLLCRSASPASSSGDAQRSTCGPGARTLLEEPGAAKRSRADGWDAQGGADKGAGDGEPATKHANGRPDAGRAGRDEARPEAEDEGGGLPGEASLLPPADDGKEDSEDTVAKDEEKEDGDKEDADKEGGGQHGEGALEGKGRGGRSRRASRSPVQMRDGEDRKEPDGKGDEASPAPAKAPWGRVGGRGRGMWRDAGARGRAGEGDVARAQALQ
ncbi:hypothetical protein T484DRAFT_1824846 [Baffinella frigidus]|nr:hypothetical protein T484DRAFT_1824846 [Cryptophyta sp. CCMP2293]